MPLKLNVGVSRKMGLPHYGSVGASCAVEVELDQGLLFQHPNLLCAKVDEAFAACRQAVESELSREQQVESPDSGQMLPSECNEGSASQNGHRRLERSSASLPAAERQLRAIEAIALRQRMDLLALLQERFDKENLSDLTRAEASRLIDGFESARTVHSVD